nr:deaminated glutathione amidase-like [Ciona intestinalis]|eukprot:XP_002131322.1 deaminated glutathione amidase-like [Ciona intestinalis]
MDPNPIIGVCQLSVGSDIEKNLQQAKDLVKECKELGAVFVFLPEACDYLCEDQKESINMAHTLTSKICIEYCKLAAELSVWISLGGIHRKCEGDPENKIRNSHIVINDVGEVINVYDKCHLFNVDIPNQVKLQKTDFVLPGEHIGKPIETPIGNIGALVCYDIRFPQISTELRKRGAEILTYPSAFTVPTGSAHWEVLLRARAIENQCYVIAAAQTGTHNSTRKSYGHSMVVDPWGTVVACAADKVGAITAKLDLNHLRKLRKEMPVFQHTRNDLY